MGQRLELQSLLEEVLGSTQVHYQAPPAQGMSYPAIKYQLDDIDTTHADNKPYKMARRYLVTLMTRNPDDTTVGKLASLPTASFNRFFVVDNLNHFVFTIFF